MASDAKKDFIPPISIDFVKHQLIWYLISLVLIVPGLVVMGMSMSTYETHAPLRLGIDFTGGTLLNYGFEKALNTSDLPGLRAILETQGLGESVVQLQQPQNAMSVESPTVTTELAKDVDEEQKALEAAEAKKKAGSPADTRSISEVLADINKDSATGTNQAVEQSKIDIKTLVSIRTKDLSTEDTVALQKALADKYGNYVLLEKNRVGPILAKEILVKGGLALLLAYALIVVYLTWRFQLDYAMFAMVALIHDTLFMLGSFSILGWYLNMEVNSMFVTAILTVIGFSVHDTIVVYDRIRENSRIFFTQKLPFKDIVNISLNQTMARSINTSLTTLAVLVALYFLGGESTQSFVLAMILGIAIGTYSSIFVAGCMLSWWRHRSDNATSGSSQQAVAS